MGKEKGGLLESKWTTIILVIVLVILAVVVVWILTGKGFEGCRQKPKPAPPGKITMLQDYKTLDSKLAMATELSWKNLS